MKLTNEIVTEVFQRFVADRAHVSSRDLEWIRGRLRKYCDEPPPELPEGPRQMTEEQRAAEREERSRRVQEAHRRAERTLTAKANAVNPMTPSQLARFLTAITRT